jgi:glutamate--cysteine ligase catalytic subunit
MINSTNWNSVRFKAPLDDDMGWRVEFRTMEIQLTPDQNAAFSLIIFILVKLFNEIPFLNFYIPISKVD